MNRLLPTVPLVALVLATGCTAPTLPPEPRPTESTADPGAATASGSPADRPTATATSGPSDGPDDTAARFVAAYEEFDRTLPAETGLALAPVGDTGAVSGPGIRVGNWRNGPAWSTIKVPLAIAASGTGSEATLRATIVDSDNSAADELWRGLGSPEAAAAATGRVINGLGGGAVTVQSQVTRPGLSASGQTEWSLESQATFAANLPCNPGARQVYDYMAQPAANQQWGIVNLRGAHLKGGWGPDTEDRYLVRQIGTFETSRGTVAVAIAVAPDSGAYADGTAVMSRIGTWLAEHQDLLPAGRC